MASSISFSHKIVSPNSQQKTNDLSDLLNRALSGSSFKAYTITGVLGPNIRLFSVLVCWNLFPILSFTYYRAMIFRRSGIRARYSTNRSKDGSLSKKEGIGALWMHYNHYSQSFMFLRTSLWISSNRGDNRCNFNRAYH